MKEKTKKYLYLLIPALLTIIIVMTIYIIKGVYPFGMSNIGYYDMNQTYVPSYARCYEILHGNDSLIFDWLEGAGMDMTSSFQGIFNPLNWSFFFIKPDYVLDAMAWLLMVKLVLISLSISYYIKKEHDLPLCFSAVLSLGYTFSGYTIQYYTNIFFLDGVIILPMIILALRAMFNKKKTVPYFLLLTWFLMLTAYMGLMMLLFILFYSFGLSFLQKDKVLRRAFIARLGLSTFTALAVSAISMVPCVIKWTKLSRASINSGDIMEMFGYSISGFQHLKLFMLFNTELAVALFVILILSFVLKKISCSRETIFKLYIFFIMLMPILNEGTDLLWHMGSYVHFPYRCAFMLTFTGIDFVAHAWHKFGDDLIIRFKAKFSQIGVVAIVMIIAAVNMFIGIKLYISFFEYGIIDRAVSYYGISEMLILNVIFYILLICFFDKKTRTRIFCIVTMIHLTVASVCFIAPVGYSKIDDFSYYVMRDEFIRESVAMKNNISMEHDYVSRIKTLYPCLSRNYAMILGMPSLTQFMAEPVAAYLDEVSALGYDNNYTANLDSGGTYFSDAVLNNKRIITYGDVYVPENAYTKYNGTGDYNIYDINYTFPFGMLTDKKILNTDCEKMNTAEHQIQVAEAFSDDNIQIFRLVSQKDAKLISSDKDQNEYIFRYELDIDTPSLLYIRSRITYSVSVDGERIVFPYYDEINNIENERDVKNTLNLISGFDKGKKAYIDVTISADDPSEIQLFFLDLEAMKKLSEKYASSCVLSYKADDNRLDMTADVDENNYLFLPLEYLDGWHAKVNGNKAEIVPVMNGAFMAVELPDGHCEINMTFMPPTIIKGAIVTLIGLVAAAVLVITKKRGKDIAEIPWIARTASVCFNLIAVAVLVVMYILPVFI